MNLANKNETKNHTYIGQANCSLSVSNDEYSNGMRGAYVVIACKGLTLTHAAQLIEAELAEHGLFVVGFENFSNVQYLDRELSSYEYKLIDKLSVYPVQFENVHYFKPDG